MREVDDYEVEGWFLQGIDFAEAPLTMRELASRFESSSVRASQLLNASKWEPIFRGLQEVDRPGWVFLSKLARTRRGIATGSNDFFLITSERAHSLGIRASMLLPCVGRALDVRGLVFNNEDYEALRDGGAKCLLVNLIGSLSAKEREYIDLGEEAGLTKRYLLANRTPWYSMEQRAPAPIWAAVFGRGDLNFVFNEAGARSLTNFHCVYPVREDATFARALTATLNAKLVRSGARNHIRGYGGGLMKFEPNDLKSILVPNLLWAKEATLQKLSEALMLLDKAQRLGNRKSQLDEELESLVIQAGNEASQARTQLL